MQAAPVDTTRRMITWRDRIGWSLAHDHEMARISGYDERGQEYFMVIETGAGFRERRNEAVIRIQEYIEAVNERGEPVNKPGEIEADGISVAEKRDNPCVDKRENWK